MNIQIIPTHWHTHSAELAEIRAQVFMQEQGVSAKDEWDGLDEQATHFLVMDAGQAIGCARLLVAEVQGQAVFHIGRVALLKPWRGQGIGQRLMREVIQYCRAQDRRKSIDLYAQCERQSFYQALGFVAQGEVFMDAGMPHIRMVYETSSEPTEHKTPGVHLLESLGEFQQQSLALVKCTRRQLAIFSRSLDPQVYDTEAMAQAIADLARTSRYTRIQLLVKDTAPLIEQGHRLARLCQRLPTSISLRKLLREPEKGNRGFILSDARGLMYKNDEDAYRGFIDQDAPAQVKRLREEFDQLWQFAEPEPRLQLLHL